MPQFNGNELSSNPAAARDPRYRGFAVNHLKEDDELDQKLKQLDQGQLAPNNMMQARRAMAPQPAPQAGGFDVGAWLRSLFGRR